MRAVDRFVVSRALGMRYRPGRLFLEALGRLDPPPRGVEVRRGVAGSCDALVVVPPVGRERPALVWFHGGAYCFGSPRVHSGLAGHLAVAPGAPVVMPRYRLAPEHPYPAAREDSLAAWRALAGEHGELVLGGDSAGGNLALVTAIALREAGDPLPAGLLLMSPWVDLTLSGDSIAANDGKDALLRRKHLRPHVDAFTGSLDPADPRISPLNADLSGLPPTLIQCGSDELFLSENIELASRLEKSGVEVDLQVYEGMWHDFQAHAAQLEVSRRAVSRMAAWAQALPA
jgi:epsilon-lactone hydrolase